jgi:hypothetical protein
MKTIAKAGIAAVVVVVLIVTGAALGASAGNTSTTGTTTSITSNITYASTTTSSASSSTSSQRSTSSLYFQVSCSGCSGTRILQSANSTSCPAANFVESEPGWKNASIADAYAGEYDFYVASQGSSFGNSDIAGNGTQSFTVSPIYGGSLVDWIFQKFTCAGTLDVALMSSNGTELWHGATSATNGTIAGP